MVGVRRRSGVGVVAVAAVLALAGCGGSGGSGAVDVRAEVDESSGVIVLPADRFALTQREGQDIASAEHVAMVLCKRKLGVATADTVRRVIPDEVDDRRFGLWVLAQAEKYGYVPPTSPEKLAAIKRNSDPSGPGVSQEEVAAAKQCVRDDATLKQLDTSELGGGPGYRPLSEAEREMQESDEYQGVVDEWRACLRGRGVTPDVEDLVPQGVDWKAVQELKVQEQDVALAVADVSCKEQVKLVPRLAALVAKAQAPVLEEYRDEFAAQRADMDKKVAFAEGVLRDAGL